LFVWFPYNQFGALFGTGELFGREKSYIVTCCVILILNFAQLFFYYFFSEAYDNLIHVLSPNTQERADVATIKGVIYSLAPSILNLAMPIFAQLFTNNNLYDIRLYRYIYPPLAFLSILLCIVVYANTKEKIVQAKTHVIQIKFIDSLREVMHNKYFWVIAMATWLGFLESASTGILNWLYNYGGICNGAQFTLITFVCQNAGLVGMLLAPFCIRKWGKRFVLIMTNVLNVVFIALMFPVIRIIDMTGTSTSFLHTYFPLILLVLCFWLNNLMNAFAQILTPTINADIRDYQQYISGERIDGMFSTITAIGGIITVATSGIVSFLYDKFGINEETASRVINDPTVMNRTMRNGAVVGETINQAMESGTADISYFALYDNNVLQKIISVLILVSIIGAIINVIPYFFYDLTEDKQQGMIKVLKIRAFFEDYGNNALSDSDLVDVVDMVDTANELINEKEVPVTKKAIKKARASKNYEAIKQAKEDYKQAIERNNEIKFAPFVVREMSRFESELGRMQIEDANMVYGAGLAGIASCDLAMLKADLKSAKALPKNTDEEKEIREYKIKFCRTRITARKYFDKYYGTKYELVAPDDTKLNELFNIEEQYDTQENALYEQLFEAEERKDKQAVKEINVKIKDLKGKFKALNKQINEEQNNRLSYTRSAKPVLDAQKVLRQAENYTHFDEIKARYDEAKNNLATAKA
jgi:Na+/melibiose symporter-like transporter